MGKGTQSYKRGVSPFRKQLDFGFSQLKLGHSNAKNSNASNSHKTPDSSVTYLSKTEQQTAFISWECAMGRATDFQAAWYFGGSPGEHGQTLIAAPKRRQLQDAEETFTWSGF